MYMTQKSLDLQYRGSSSSKYDIDKVYGDKAYDNRNNFNILDKINAEPAIKIRKNASVRSKGCPLRRDEVLLIRKLGYDVDGRRI